MTTVKMPASLDEAVTSLSGIDNLLRSKEWEKSAIVATFVELRTSRGGDPATNAKSRIGRLSPLEFAKLGITGLRTADTVRVYVQNWLDYNDGKYPTPGKAVVLPDRKWPPQDENLGSRLSVDPQKAIQQIIDKHGAQVIAEAARRPEVAAAIHDDFEASTEMIRETGRRLEANRRLPRPGGGRTRDTDAIDALQQSIVEITAEKYRKAGEELVAELAKSDGTYI